MTVEVAVEKVAMEGGWEARALVGGAAGYAASLIQRGRGPSRPGRCVRCRLNGSERCIGWQSCDVDAPVEGTIANTVDGQILTRSKPVRRCGRESGGCDVVFDLWTDIARRLVVFIMDPTGMVAATPRADAGASAVMGRLCLLRFERDFPKDTL